DRCMTELAEKRGWEFEIAAPPEAIWPLISDTARFNEAGRLPKYQVEDIPLADGRVLRLARARVAGIALEWEDGPYEWVKGRSFRQIRIFRNGPIKRFGPIVALTQEKGGTHLSYALQAEPNGLLGALLFRLGFLEAGGRTIKRLVKSATQFLAGQKA